VLILWRRSPTCCGWQWRLGRPGELGAVCAFECGVQAGYISGVNRHLGGGSYAGLV